MDDDWGDARFPLVPGHEIVGVVEEAGADVADLRRGDRVGIGYQQEACFECAFCQQGTEQLCPSQKVIAVDTYGGFADHIIVDGRFAFRLPAQLDSATSAPLLSSGLTVFAGILRAHLTDRSQVAVLGAGGLGHLAIQFLHKMGHSVSALSHSPAKRELIERLGGAYVDTGDPEYRDALPRDLRLHPFDPECRLRPGLLCEDAETEGPALPGGIAAGHNGLRQGGPSRNAGRANQLVQRSTAGCYRRCVGQRLRRREAGSTQRPKRNAHGPSRPVNPASDFAVPMRPPLRLA